MTSEAALKLVQAELSRALKKHKPMTTPHDGYAVILEEVDELKDWVWKRPAKRNVDLMRQEAVQVAAMAIRFVIDLT